MSAHNKNKGPWIVKPVASSRGRGIFLAKTPDEIQAHISSDEQVRVCLGIFLRISGFLFDL